MRTLDYIQEHIDDETLMILVINNNKKPLLDAVCNSIYRKCKTKKSKINTGKGLYNKLCCVKNSLVLVNIDYDKLQFGSSKTISKFNSELDTIKLCATENKSKFIFKYELKVKLDNFKEYWRRNSYHVVSYSNVFDLIILIDRDNVSLLKTNVYFGENINSFDISQLVRSTKLKKLDFLQNKESM